MKKHQSQKTQDCFLSSGDLQPENNTLVVAAEGKLVNVNKKITGMDNKPRKRPKHNLSKLSLTLADLSLDTSDQDIPSPLLPGKQESPLLSITPPNVFHKLQFLSTTPPTGRKPLTPLIPTTSSTFFTKDANGNIIEDGEGGGKRRHSLPASLEEGKQGIPKMTPQLDYLFQQFLSTQENWDLIMSDISECELGRGPARFKSLLQKDKTHQRQPPPPPASSSPSPSVNTEVINANLNVNLVNIPKNHTTFPLKAEPVPTAPSESTGVVSRKSTDPIPTTVVSPVLVSSPPPPALTSKKHPKDKVPRVGTCGPPVSKSVPKFFWPEGKPTSNTVLQNTLTKAECKLKEENNCVNYDKFGELMVASGLPLYWKKPFWMALCLSPDGICTSKIFIPFLRYLLTDVPDDAAKFVRILSSASRNFPVGYDKNNYNNNNTNMNIKYYTDHGNYCQDLKFVELTMTEFVQMIQDIIDTHPGLGFLRDAPEFHSRYITTVISRIFYKVNRSWSGRLTLTEIRRSNLLGIIKRLEEETDINTITEYFSYEHFYVIYCKFWELDKDHDLLIDKHDLAAHAEHAMSSRIIERIFSGTVLRGWDVANPLMAAHDKMTYSDFVWFLLSEEDKKTPTAIEYWFRCLDVDGDGIISPYELQYFYSEQENRIESLGIEPLHFSNVYCQIVDMLHCSSTGIRLKDLKNNPYLAANVFNTVFNLEKYLEHEQRDPFAASPGNQENGEGDSDWDRYAATEYELLIAEESPGDHLHDSGLEEILMTP